MEHTTTSSAASALVPRRPGNRLRHDNSLPTPPLSPIETATFRKRSLPAAIVTRQSGVAFAGMDGQPSPDAHSPRTSGFRPSVEIPPTPMRRSLHVFRSPGAAEGQARDGGAFTRDVKSPVDHVEHVRGGPLSFWHTHFCRPTGEDPSKADDASHRRFSFLSLGSIITGILLLILLLAVAAAATAVSLRHSRKAAPIRLINPGNHTIQPPVTNGSSPIRAAIAANFADPTFWYYEGTYYAFATNNAAGILNQPDNATTYDYGTSNIQIATSTDFITWDLLNSTHDPLPTTGRWVIQGLTASSPHIPKANIWAPGLSQRSTDRKFVMYYAAGKNAPDNATVGTALPGHPVPHCVGAAVSVGLDPAGPYEPMNETLACEINQGGAIDPAGFQDDDGTLYVVYKIDGNNIGHGGSCGNTVKPIVPTPLMLQKMEADGVTTSGNATQILDRTASDGPLIEAPALVRSSQGVYFLFFSSGCTRAPTYDIKYATATNIEGPYTRASEPLLQTGDYGEYKKCCQLMDARKLIFPPGLVAPGSAAVHSDGKMHSSSPCSVNGDPASSSHVHRPLRPMDNHICHDQGGACTNSGL
ncbi:glycoside hydrolase family 43 protein [Teratosphaeria destructans]|uniref:Glycoside hydrolase family 43 protein n=1 Tax=Teratosphaeria destructans TaxID=418781 RepID=A0A9W7SUI2_9PEZI|nr:glycoside hydrolase family 43 protein [Teratosphaeria destructans]